MPTPEHVWNLQRYPSTRITHTPEIFWGWFPRPLVDLSHPFDGRQEVILLFLHEALKLLLSDFASCFKFGIMDDSPSLSIREKLKQNLPRIPLGEAVA